MTPAEECTLALMRLDAEHMAAAAAKTQRAGVYVGYLQAKPEKTTWERAIRREPTMEEIDALRATHGRRDRQRALARHLEAGRAARGLPPAAFSDGSRRWPHDRRRLARRVRRRVAGERKLHLLRAGDVEGGAVMSRISLSTTASNDKRISQHKARAYEQLVEALADVEIGREDVQGWLNDHWNLFELRIEARRIRSRFPRSA